MTGYRTILLLPYAIAPAIAGVLWLFLFTPGVGVIAYGLRKAGIETLVFAGIVTNGGVASTLRDAHVRDFATVLLSDGCAAFDPRVHDATVAELSSVSSVMSCADFITALSP